MGWLVNLTLTFYVTIILIEHVDILLQLLQLLIKGSFNHRPLWRGTYTQRK